MRIAPENTSGQGSLAVIPEEIKGWNWGAFFFSWLWGISNKVWIALLAAIPYVGVIMCIVLGVKGNEWAWRNKRWDSIEHFKRTQRTWAYWALALFILGVLAVAAAVIIPNVVDHTQEPTPVPSQTLPSPASIPEPPKIEEGWVRIIITDVGSIDHPTDFLELQSEEYRDIAKEAFQVLRLGKSDFTLQQVGLNELKPSALEEYRRVIFMTEYLNPGEKALRANEKYTMNREELAEVENQIVDGLIQGFETQKTITGMENKLVESVSLEIKEVNGMFPIVHTYKRQLNDNPVVLVETYMFQNYDRIHYLSFSCRVVDEEECRDIYDKILYSFRLQ